MRRAAALLAVAIAAAASGRAAAPPTLKYVVIVSRHGVRSPTWTADRLNQYSARPWPDFGVPPGDLTPHGRALMARMGEYYGEWLAREGLLRRPGCADAGRIYVRADSDQRTVETGKALAETVLPGCGVAVHALKDGDTDPLFDPITAGLATPDADIAASAIRERLGPQPQRLVDAHRAAFDELDRLLAGDGHAARHVLDATNVDVAAGGRSVELTGPFNTASTLSENLLLEYGNGFEGESLGWGQLDAGALVRVLALHATYADLMRRTPYLARIRGSNLLAHVLASLEQAATGTPTPGALGSPGDVALILSGHDTNLSNISGMLGLSWTVSGYQPDDTPPGGALVFSLWNDSAAHHHIVRIEYVVQTLEQMRRATPLTLATPPARAEITMPGCEADARAARCSWDSFVHAAQTAIDPKLISK